MGRKGFDVAEFRFRNFNNDKLTSLFNKENTKFKSFPKDSCGMKPQNLKTAYFYEKYVIRKAGSGLLSARPSECPILPYND